MAGILHLVAAHLNANVDAHDRAAELARALTGATGVDYVMVGRSEHDLVVACWISDATEIEAFAASDAHMAFVMDGLAHASAGVWTAAASIAVPAPEPGGHTIWAFAVMDDSSMYEWEIRNLLDEVRRLPGLAAAGVTVEERDAFRAAGVVRLSETDLPAFETAVADLHDAWSRSERRVLETVVPVIFEQAAD